MEPADVTYTRFANLISAGLLDIGDGYRAKNEELGGDGEIFLRAGHVTDSHIDLDGVERFHSHLTERVASKLSRTGDTIITTKGNSTGRTSFVTPDLPRFVYSPHLCYWRSLDPRKLPPGFLRYWARSAEFQQQLRGMQASTDMAPYLSLTDQRRLQISLPPSAVQHAIAHILGTIDDKIAMNRRTNDTIEAMARTLFKSWFVDFDPVRDMAEGRQPSGMNAETAKLFPSEFQMSELGAIPKGWRNGTLLDVGKLLSGGTPKTDRSDYWGGGVAWASAKDVSQCGRTFLIDTERSITQYGLDESATQLIPAFSTVVVARGATTGRMVVLGREMAMNQTCYALVTTQEAPFFLYSLFQREVTSLVHGAHGSVFDTITTSTFAGSQIVIPPPANIHAFESAVAPMLRRVLASTEESRALVAIRDTLLPRLLSGELRLADAERFVAASI